MAGQQIPERRTLDPGETLVEQGAPGDELYLVLDGVLAVEIDGAEVAEIGPGAVVGEKALLEGGARTATLRAQTPLPDRSHPGRPDRPSGARGSRRDAAGVELRTRASDGA